MANSAIRVPTNYWTNVDSDQTMIASIAYQANSAVQLSFMLPLTMTVGDEFIVLSVNTGGILITQEAGQQIICNAFESTTVGVTGGLEGDAIGDAVFIVCTDDTPGAQVLELYNTRGDITVI